MIKFYKILPLLFVLIPAFTVAQNKYTFNYLIEYEMSLKNGSINSKIFYLTNSKDNSYVARVSEIDSLRYRIIFRDHKTLASSNVILLKTEFFEAEFFNINCEDVSNSYDLYKGKEELYNFYKSKDTILNDERYSVYQLKSNLNFNKIKRRKIGSNIYVLDTINIDFLPVFFYPPAYKIWQIQNNIMPNGINFKKLFVNYLNEVREEETLIDYIKIDKKILISGNCN